MATPTGAVRFDAGEVNRALQFTTNRLCILEEQTRLTTLEVATELALGKSQPLGVSKTTLRALFWAGCDDGGMTQREAGELVDLIGHKRAVSLAIEAFDAAFPDEEEAKGDDKVDTGPPAAAAG